MIGTKLRLSQVLASVAERLRREIRNLIPKGSQVRVLPLANSSFVRATIPMAPADILKFAELHGRRSSCSHRVYTIGLRNLTIRKGNVSDAGNVDKIEIETRE